MNNIFDNLIKRHLGVNEPIQPRVPGRFEPEYHSELPDVPQENEKPVAIKPVDQQTTAQTSDPNRINADHRNVMHSPKVKQNAVASPDSKINYANAVTEVKTAKLSATLLGENADKVGSDGFQSQQVPNNARADQGQNSEFVVTDNQKSFLSAPMRPIKPAGLAGEQNTDNHSDRQRLTGVLTTPKRNFSADDTRIPQFVTTDPPASIIMPVMLKVIKEPEQRVPASVNTIIPQQTPEVENTVRNIARHESLLPASRALKIDILQIPDSQGKADKQETVINVTIGRVEVRAVKAPTNNIVQTAKKPSGIMPLDEYLKNREDGRVR